MYEIFVRTDAYKVVMKSGRLTREKWVSNEVAEGSIVKDKDGRIFRTKLVCKVSAPALQMTRLERIK